MEQNKEDGSVSLLRVAMGAIEERINLELPRIIDNIQDLNTNAKKKKDNDNHYRFYIK